MPLDPGTKLGPYEILSSLGVGGMGEVYKANDTRLERTVAIKVLPEHLSTDPERRERFEREARVISSLNHPHIGVLYDIGHQDGTDYLVMEYLLSGFIRVVTHPRVFVPPSSLEAAIEFSNQIRSQPNCVSIVPGHRHWEIFTRLCRDAEVKGNLVADAYLAALAIESGSGESGDSS